MPLSTNPNFWFPQLATILDRLHPGVNITNAQCQVINDALTNLPFGVGCDQVNAILAANGFPANALIAANFPDANFSAWQRGELAWMTLRRLVRENQQPANFDANATAAAFMAPVNDLDQARQFLIDRFNPVGERRISRSRFSAIVDAFSDNGRYAFSEENRHAFFTALVGDGTAANPGRVGGLLIAQHNFSTQYVSAAIIQFLRYADLAEFARVATLYSNDANAVGNVLQDQRAAFLDAVRANVHHLIESDVPYGTLVPTYFADAAALHAAILANFQEPVAQRMTVDQFQQIIQNLYQENALAPNPLTVHLGALAQAFIGQVAEPATAAQIAALLPYVAHLPDCPNKQAVYDAVLARADNLMNAVDNPDDFNALVACLSANEQGRECLRNEIFRDNNARVYLTKNVPLAVIVRAYNDAKTNQADPDLTAAALFTRALGSFSEGGLGLIEKIDRINQLRAAVGNVNLIYPVDAGNAVAELNRAIIAQIPVLVNQAATFDELRDVLLPSVRVNNDLNAVFQVHLALPATIEALFGKVPPITIEQIVQLHNVQGAQQLFGLFIAEIAGLNLDAAHIGDSLDRIQALERFVVAGGPAHTQKAAFDTAVAAQAPRLLAAPALDAAGFARVVGILTACDTPAAAAPNAPVGLAALNTYAADPANVITLLNKGVSIADIAAARAAPGNDAAAVVAVIVAAVGGAPGPGRLTTPAELLRAQNAIIAQNAIAQLVGPNNLAAFRTALAVPANVERLFRDISVAAANNNFDAINTLVYGARDAAQVFAVGDAFVDAFVAKFTLANIEALLDPARAGGALTINQIEQLATKKIDYTHADNKRFRQIHIDAIKAEFKTYLDSLVKNADGTWSHDTPPVVVVAQFQAIKDRLVAFRDRLQKFNEGSVIAPYARVPVIENAHHGLYAFQDFLQTQPAYYERLRQVYGNANSLNTQLAFASITPNTQRDTLITNLKARIDAARTGPELTGVITDLENGVVPGFSLGYRNDVRAVVVLHLKDATVLSGLIQRGVTPDQIETACRFFATPDDRINKTAITVSLHAKIRSFVDSVAVVPAADVVLFNQILAQVAVPAYGLNYEVLARYIDKHFVTLVANRFITAANFAAVKAFVEAHVPAIGADLSADLNRRRDLFLADIGADTNTIPTHEIKKALEDYRKAYVAVSVAGAADLAAFREAVFAGPADEAHHGSIPALLAKGITVAELVALYDAAAPVITAVEIKAKAIDHVNGEITRLVGVGAAAAADKIIHKAAFKKLTRIFALIQDEAAPAPSLRQPLIDNVRRNAVALLRAGVDPSDLLAIDSTLTVDVLYGLASAPGAIVDPVEQAALLVSLQGVRMATVDPLAFLDRLPVPVKNAIGRLMYDAHLAFRDQKEVCRIALQDITARFPIYVSETGIINADAETKERIEQAYQETARVEIARLAREQSSFLATQGVDVAAMHTTEESQNTVQKLHAVVQAFYRKRGSIRGVASLKGTLESLREKVDATVGVASAQAYDTLKVIDDALQKISDVQIDALDQQVAAERQQLVALQQQVQDGAAAIEVLIGAESMSLSNSADIERIVDRLVARGVAQDRFLTTNRDVLRGEARQLLTDLHALNDLAVSLDGRIQQSATGLADLKQKFKDFKAHVRAAMVIKGDRANVAAVVETGLSEVEIDLTAAPNALERLGENAQVTALFTAPGGGGALMAAAATGKRVVDLGAIHNKTFIAKLDGVGDKKGFCPIKVVSSGLAAGQRVVGVQLMTGASSVDSTTQVKTAIKAGRGKLSDAERVLAFDAGKALAQEYVRLAIKQQNMSFFGESSPISITGNFFVTPRMSAGDKREVYFNIVAIGCAIRVLEAAGYKINKDCQGYKDFVAARGMYMAEVAYDNRPRGGVHPQFAAKLATIDAKTIDAAVAGESAVKAVQNDIENLGRDLGRGDLGRGP